MNTHAAQQTPRFRALDGLRGLAAILVVLFHVQWRDDITGTRFVMNGYLAVDLFFIISGFVIATNYSTRIVNLSTSLRFVGLRFFRLYPLHAVMLGVFVVLEFCKLVATHTIDITPEQQAFSGGMSNSSLAANVFLVHGLGWVQHWGWNGPSWSISCEFFAYLAFAIVSLLGLIRSKLFLIGGAAIAAVAYVGIALNRGTLDASLDLGIVRCFSGFFFGMVIALIPEVRWGRFSQYAGKYGVLFATGVLLSMAVVSGPMIVIVIPLFVALVVCLRWDRGSVAHLLNSKLLQFLGRISYSIYMVHEFTVLCLLVVLKRMVRTSFDPGIGKVIAATNPWVGDMLTLTLVAAVVLLASQTYRFIEEPGRALGRRLLRASAQARASVVMVAQEPMSPQLPGELC